MKNTNIDTEEVYEPENLKLWEHPDFYTRKDWPLTYVFLHRFWDSDALERSNFECALAAIGGESETVKVVSERHWAVGRLEFIAIHPDDSRALRIADIIVSELSSHPVVVALADSLEIVP